MGRSLVLTTPLTPTPAPFLDTQAGPMKIPPKPNPIMKPTPPSLAHVACAAGLVEGRAGIPSATPNRPARRRAREIIQNTLSDFIAGGY